MKAAYGAVAAVLTTCCAGQRVAAILIGTDSSGIKRQHSDSSYERGQRGVAGSGSRPGPSDGEMSEQEFGSVSRCTSVLLLAS
jgi:hypothetical protein